MIRWSKIQKAGRGKARGIGTASWHRPVKFFGKFWNETDPQSSVTWLFALCRNDKNLRIFSASLSVAPIAYVLQHLINIQILLCDSWWLLGLIRLSKLFQSCVLRNSSLSLFPFLVLEIALNRFNLLMLEGFHVWLLGFFVLVKIELERCLRGNMN